MLPSSDADYAALEEFFSALGFAPGESWTGRRSKGEKFEAFESGIELAMGQDMPAADLVVEVDNADILAEAARAKGFTFVSDIADHDWGARLFVLQIPLASAISPFSATTKTGASPPANRSSTPPG